MLYILLGLTVGTIGSLVGIGGGFVIVPLLLSTHPELSHQQVAAISIFVVAMNATSASLAYYLRKLVHPKAALVFGLVSLPGALLGVYLEHFVSRELFSSIFGIALVLYAIYLFLKSKTMAQTHMNTAANTITSQKYVLGACISFFVGILAAFLGIGGGMFYVPMLSTFGLSVQMAAGTSQLILMLNAWVTTGQHFLNGDIGLSQVFALQIGVGAVIGAQIGAHIAHRVPGRIILKLLAVALLFTGLKLLLSSL